MKHASIAELQKSGLPVFVWGNGEVGKLAHSKLSSQGVKVTAYVSDDLNAFGGGTDKRASDRAV